MGGDLPQPIARHSMAEETFTPPRSGQSMSPGRWRAMVAMIAIFVFLNGKLLHQHIYVVLLVSISELTAVATT